MTTTESTLTAAEEVVSYAFQLCSATIVRPLEALCSHFWQLGYEGYEGEGADVRIVDEVELLAATTGGGIFWVSTEPTIVSRATVTKNDPNDIYPAIP